MISYIEGPPVTIEEGTIVAEAGHVDLAIHVPVSLLPELPRMEKEVTIYTYLQIREDAMTLYGFLHSQDGDMFGQLLGVNSIGPKDTLGILSVFRPGDPRLAIISEGVKAPAKTPGIGNKTARRLILDLKDRISMDGVLGDMIGGVGMDAVNTGVFVAGLVETVKETVQALAALGYTSAKASRAVKQVEVTDGVASEDVLKASLKHLSFL